MGSLSTFVIWMTWSSQTIVKKVLLFVDRENIFFILALTLRVLIFTRVITVSKLAAKPKSGNTIK